MTRSTAGGGSAASPCSLIVLAVIIAMMMRAVGMRFRMPDIVEDGRWALWLIPSLLIWSIWCISYSLGKAGIISWIAYKGVNAAIRDAARRNRGSAALWPVRFLLDRVLPQGSAAPPQPSAAAPAAADAETQLASTAATSNGSALGPAPGTSRPVASGSAADSGGPRRRHRAQQASDAETVLRDTRTMEQLRAAADWQLERAYAKLREVANAERERVARLEAERPSSSVDQPASEQQHNTSEAGAAPDQVTAQWEGLNNVGGRDPAGSAGAAPPFEGGEQPSGARSTIGRAGSAVASAAGAVGQGALGVAGAVAAALQLRQAAMGKELAQQSADAGREPGGTAEAIAARGGDPAIAAFIGGGGASDSLNGATSAGAAEQPSSSADPESDGAARLDADAAGGEVGVAERVSPLDAETSGGLANNVQPSGGIRSRLGTLGAYSQGAWNSLAQIASRRREPEWIPVQTDHPAVDLVLERARTGSRPGHRTDGCRLGLVVEGGGMRGCVSAGSLMALYQLGLKDSFDAIYGASAGAINATYFLTGQREGVDIYAEDIANRTFCDLSRLLGPSKKPVLDLSFLIDYVMEEVKPLRWDEVLASPIPLKIVASCLDQLRPVILENFTDKEDLAVCLKASANIPVIAGQPLAHRGRRLVDGAVFEAVPFRQAISDGCTHVIVLCTRPPFKGGRLQKAINDAVEAGIKRGFLSPSYMREAWRAEMRMLAAEKLSHAEMLVLALEEGASELPWFAGCQVYPVFPGAASNFAPVCIDPPTLRAGVAEGHRAVMRSFDPQGLGLTEQVAEQLDAKIREKIMASFLTA